MELTTRIVCAVPVDGKSKKGRMLTKALAEILDYDKCTRILIEKVGVEAFVRQLATLVPKDNLTYCNEDYYRVQWQRAIWAAAWNAWQSRKKEEWTSTKSV